MSSCFTELNKIKNVLSDFMFMEYGYESLIYFFIVVSFGETKYNVGVLVQANHGSRENLRIAGVPVGQEITDLRPEVNQEKSASSIIIIVATDGPFLPHQLKALAKRSALGLARDGSIAGSLSGDLMIAFSTANKFSFDAEGIQTCHHIPDFLAISPFYLATIQATEEAIINALVSAETMEGCDGTKFYALPHDRLKNVLKKYNRLLT
jgi:L-aminopeptidase/D-esterase-like protein